MSKITNINAYALQRRRAGQYTMGQKWHLDALVEFGHAKSLVVAKRAKAAARRAKAKSVRDA